MGHKDYESRNFKIVTQEHSLGCGVACVASALNISYRQALKRFSEPERAWTRGFFCKDLVRVLSSFGECYAIKYLKDDSDPVIKKAGTIVFTCRSERYPAGHYLIRTSSGWMNPWANFPDITPAKGRLVKNLPSRPVYAIYPKKVK